MSIPVFRASSLSEFFSKFNDAVEVLRCHEEKVGIKKDRPYVWSRGQSKSAYDLTPSILRGLKGANGEEKQRHLDLLEMYRPGHHDAITRHIIGSGSNNIIDRNELLQHHEIPTRYLDWTERVETSLGFALEPHLRNEKKVWEITDTPTVWILSPSLLNYNVFKLIAGNFTKDDYRGLLCEFPSHSGDIAEKLKGLMENYDAAFEKWMYIDDYKYTNILSLSAIADYRISAGSQLSEMLKVGEFNPFFYIALRIYGDRIKVSRDTSLPPLPPLPPIATLQPANSDRIVAQRGTFTVFPANAAAPALNLLPQCQDCICRIELVGAPDIAKQLSTIGFRLADLYPDLDSFAKSINSGI